MLGQGDQRDDGDDGDQIEHTRAKADCDLTGDFQQIHALALTYGCALKTHADGAAVKNK